MEQNFQSKKLIFSFSININKKKCKEPEIYDEDEDNNRLKKEMDEDSDICFIDEKITLKKVSDFGLKNTSYEQSASSSKENEFYKGNGFLIPCYREKPLVSKYSPEKEAINICSMLKDECKRDESRFVVLISPVNPYIFKHLGDLKVICIEQSEILYEHYLQFFKFYGFEINEENLDSEFGVEILANYFDQQSSNIFIFHRLTRKAISRVIQSIPEKNPFIFSNAFLAKSSSLIREGENLCAGELRRKTININTAKRFSKDWTSNFLKNSPIYILNEGLEILAGILNKEIPVVVLGAGSSIDSCMDKLKYLSDKAIFIAVDTVVRALLKSDLPIDIIVSSDSQSLNSLYITKSGLIEQNIDKKEKRQRDARGESYINALHETKGDLPILVAMPTVDPILVEKYYGKILFSSVPFPLTKKVEQFCGEKIEIGAGGTVSSMAFELAVLLNPSAIFLAGIDFCYSKGRLHCQNTLFDTYYFSKTDYFYSYESFVCKSQAKSRSFFREDRTKKSVRTDPKFMLFLDWFSYHTSKAQQARKLYLLSDQIVNLENIEVLDDESLKKVVEKEDIVLVDKVNSGKRDILDKLKKDKNSRMKDSSDKFEKIKAYMNFLENLQIEAKSAYSLIKSGLTKQKLNHESDSMLDKNEVYIRYFKMIEEKLLSFESLKLLINMSFQRYLLEVQFESATIDTHSFYTSLCEELEFLIDIIEKVKDNVGVNKVR